MKKISIIVDNFSDNITEQIEIIKRLNLNYIELRNVNGKNIIDNTNEEIINILKELRKNHISVSSICTCIGKPTVNETFKIQVLKLYKSLKIAKILKAKNIRIFSEINYNTLYLVKLISKLSYIYKVKICIENEKNTRFAKINNIFEFFQNRYCKKIGLTLDVANLVELGESPFKAINLLKNQITYLHIRDLYINNKETNMFEGTCDIKNILSFIDSKNIFITYEPKLYHISIEEQYAFVASNIGRLVNFINKEH